MSCPSKCHSSFCYSLIFVFFRRLFDFAYEIINIICLLLIVFTSNENSKWLFGNALNQMCGALWQNGTIFINNSTHTKKMTRTKTETLNRLIGSASCNARCAKLSAKWYQWLFGSIERKASTFKNPKSNEWMTASQNQMKTPSNERTSAHNGKGVFLSEWTRFGRKINKFVAYNMCAMCALQTNDSNDCEFVRTRVIFC